MRHHTVLTPLIWPHSHTVLSFSLGQENRWITKIIIVGVLTLHCTIILGFCRIQLKIKINKIKKSRVGACLSQNHVLLVSMGHDFDTCRNIDFPILASEQLPQPFREWLGEANDQMFLNRIQCNLRRLQDVCCSRVTPFSGFLGRADVSMTFSQEYLRPIDVICGATILYPRRRRRNWRYPRHGESFSILFVVVVENGGPSASGRHLCFRKWGHPRWRPEAEGPPFSTTVWNYWLIMMTWSNGNIFHVTGPLWGEFTGHWWIHLTKASNTESWCFLWSALKQIVVWAIVNPAIWNATAGSKDNIKSLRYWILWGESTGDQCIPLTKGQ